MLAVDSVQATLRILSSLMKDREVGPHGAEPLSIAELWAANTTSLHVLFTLTFLAYYHLVEWVLDDEHDLRWTTNMPIPLAWDVLDSRLVGPHGQCLTPPFFATLECAHSHYPSLVLVHKQEGIVPHVLLPAAESSSSVL